MASPAGAPRARDPVTGKRLLTEAELEQRRKAARNAGRPRNDAGTRAARRAVEEARKMGQAAQPAAARTLIAGMHGLLPGSTAESMASCAKEVLSRWGNPVRHDVGVTGVGDSFSFDLGPADQPVTAEEPAATQDGADAAADPPARPTE